MGTGRATHLPSEYLLATAAIASALRRIERREDSREVEDGIELEESIETNGGPASIRTSTSRRIGTRIASNFFA